MRLDNSVKNARRAHLHQHVREVQYEDPQRKQHVHGCDAGEQPQCARLARVESTKHNDECERLRGEDAQSGGDNGDASPRRWDARALIRRWVVMAGGYDRTHECV